MRQRVNKMDVLRNAMSNDILVTNADKRAVREMIGNASIARATLLNKLIDPRRDIDQECGYPKELSTAQYKLMYDREGLATRVVSLMPEESWSSDPDIIETEDGEETEFEKAFSVLDLKIQIWSYLAKVDEISGIGRFGILLLGFDDGLDLNLPVEGVDERGEKTGKAAHKLLFLRAFDESVVSVKSVEQDRTNPRFSMPTVYSIKFENLAVSRSDAGQTTMSTGQELQVHWSRIIHVADNRKTSEVYGIPRMQVVFNRLFDLRKIVGGSGEMFWKGGFPGYAFEMDANARKPTEDELTTLRQSIDDYSNGLQRYLNLQGVSTKSLTSQVADPKGHVDVQLELVAITMGVPKRVFMGSEQAKLASTQDAKSWNKRITRRQKKYITPYIIRPLIDRLVATGALPEPKEYDVVWNDLNALSEMEQAEILAKQIEAMAKYVTGGVDMLIPPEEFLTIFAGLPADQVKLIMDAALKRQEEQAAEEEERMAEEAAVIEEENARLAADKKTAAGMIAK